MLEGACRMPLRPATHRTQWAWRPPERAPFATGQWCQKVLPLASTLERWYPSDPDSPGMTKRRRNTFTVCKHAG